MGDIYKCELNQSDLRRECRRRSRAKVLFIDTVAYGCCVGQEPKTAEVMEKEPRVVEKRAGEHSVRKSRERCVWKRRKELCLRLQRGLVGL